MIEVLARARGRQTLERVSIDAGVASDRLCDWDVPITGTVVGAILNDEEALLEYSDELNQAPYLAPPRAPVLYLKPANTWSADGQAIVVPPDLEAIEAGACIGLVLGRTATRVAARDALEYLAGYVVINDLCAPHQSVYRPAIRERCRDGFCAIGPWIMPRQDVRSPDALVLRTFVNDVLRAETSTHRLVRRCGALLAAVTEFMSLSPGDVLLIGPGADRPRVRAGDTVRIEVAGVGRVENRLVGSLDPEGRGVPDPRAEPSAPPP